MNNTENQSHENDVFLRSLSGLTPDMIGEKKPKKKASSSEIISTAARWLLTAVCVVVLVVSLSYVVKTYVETTNSNKRFDDLAKEFAEDDGSGSPSPSLAKAIITPNYSTSHNMSEEDYEKYREQNVSNEELERMKSKLYNKKEQYPDLYGWIRVEGTIIDYPVMQYTDNDFYLYRYIDGTASQSGSIFADYRCFNDITLNRNTIFYGHHMDTVRAMFRDIDFYLEEDFFNKHKYIEFYTLDAKYTFEIFAIYNTTKDYDYIRTSFNNDTEFIAFCEEIRGNSIYYRDGVTFDKDSHILTLSTCDNRTSDGRIALQAVLVKVEK